VCLSQRIDLASQLIVFGVDVFAFAHR
jgi:hypothetical protein